MIRAAIYFALWILWAWRLRVLSLKFYEDRAPETALGLAVAVPAVMAYNWLQRRNKAIAEEMARFTNDIHGYMMSNGSVKPMTATRGAAKPTAPAGTVATGGATTGAASPKKL